MKKLLILLALLCSFATANAKGRDRHGLRLVNPDGEYEPQESNFETSFQFSYRNAKFLNGNYVSNLQNHNLKQGFGFDASGALCFWGHLELEVDGFVHSFSRGELDGVRQAGIGVYANYFVLPTGRKFCRIFRPYLGLGYQGSTIDVRPSNRDDYDQIPKAGTSGLMMKAGSRFYIGKTFFLRMEYKQMIPTSSRKLFRTLEVGVGVTFGNGD